MILAQITNAIPENTFSDVMKVVHDIAPNMTAEQDVIVLFVLHIVARVVSKYWLSGKTGKLANLIHFAAVNPQPKKTDVTPK